MKLILGGWLLLFSLWGNAAEIMTMNVDRSSTQFVVTLPSNPTTGFQWKVTKYDKMMLKMTGSHYIAPKTKLIGAGGQMTFTFAQIKGKSYPKSTQMLFTYGRAWEPKGGSVKQVNVNFSKTSQKK